MSKKDKRAELIRQATAAAEHYQNEELEEILLGYVKSKGDTK